MNKILALVATVLFVFVGICLSAIMDVVSITMQYGITGIMLVVFYLLVLKSLDEATASRGKDSGVHNDNK